MLTIKIFRRAAQFLTKLPPKHAKQIAQRLHGLMLDPDKMPSAELKGHAPLRKMNAGEYSIIYSIIGSSLDVILIGKRNDDEIYEMLKRLKN